MPFLAKAVSLSRGPVRVEQHGDALDDVHEDLVLLLLTRVCVRPDLQV